MRFRILGSGPGLPQLDKNLSSVLVEQAGKLILLDTGEGCSKSLLGLGYSADQIDLVAISHYHPDHISGFFMLMQMLYLNGRSKPLTVYLPENKDFIIESLKTMYTFREKFGFKLEFKDCSEIGAEHPQIVCAPTDHLLGYQKQIEAVGAKNQMKSFAFRIKGERGDLVYSSDLSTVDCIEPLIKGCHSIIVDALHPDATQIIKLKDLSVKRVLLNHGISDELDMIMAEASPEGFDFAEENRWYEI